MSAERPAASRPDFLTSFDGEWSYYVAGHDEGELLQIDELDELQWEKLWMREIPTSQADDYGLWMDDPCYEGEMVWIECSETTNGAEPWMGVKYAPAD